MVALQLLPLLLLQANVIDKFVVAEFCFFLLLGGWRCVLFFALLLFGFWLGVCWLLWLLALLLLLLLVLLLLLLVQLLRFLVVFGSICIWFCYLLFCSWYFCWYFLLLCLLIFYWYFYCKFTGIYAVILLVFYWYLRLVFASYYINCIKAI